MFVVVKPLASIAVMAREVNSALIHRIASATTRVKIKLPADKTRKGANSTFALLAGCESHKHRARGDPSRIPLVSVTAPSRCCRRRTQSRSRERPHRRGQRAFFPTIKLTLAAGYASADLGTLALQAEAVNRALVSARDSATLANERHQRALPSCLDMVDAQRAALQAERQDTQLRGQRAVSTILLAEALGGGWEWPGEDQLVGSESN